MMPRKLSREEAEKRLDDISDQIAQRGAWTSAAERELAAKWSIGRRGVRKYYARWLSRMVKDAAEAEHVELKRRELIERTRALAAKAYAGKKWGVALRAIETEAELEGVPKTPIRIETPGSDLPPIHTPEGRAAFIAELRASVPPELLREALGEAPIE